MSNRPAHSFDGSAGHIPVRPFHKVRSVLTANDLAQVRPRHGSAYARFGPQDLRLVHLHPILTLPGVYPPTLVPEAENVRRLQVLSVVSFLDKLCLS